VSPPKQCREFSVQVQTFFLARSLSLLQGCNISINRTPVADTW